MKKHVSKLSLSTDKIVSLSKTQLQHAQGGGPSNGGQSYTCLASSGGGGGNTYTISARTC